MRGLTTRQKGGRAMRSDEDEIVEDEELKGESPETPVSSPTIQAKSDDLSWTNEEFDAYDRETIGRVNAQVGLCKTTQNEYLIAKEVASARKKLHKKANEALTDLIEEREKERGKPRQRSLFDHPMEVVETPEDTSWRDVEISYLTQHGLSESIVNAIEDNGINTIGKLADFTEKNPLTDLKKIGQAKAEAIEKALESFWAERNRPSTVESSEPDTDEPEVTTQPEPEFDNIDI